MFKRLKIVVGALRAALKTQRELALENWALRQQLAALKQHNPRPRPGDAHRLFWVLLSRLWRDWQGVLPGQPETVIR